MRWALVLVLAAGALAGEKLEAVPMRAVQIDDRFWAPRLKTLHEVTLPHNLDTCEATGRLRNFDRAAGKLDGKFEGLYFNDSDVYKVLEGAAYALALRRDPALEKRVDALIDRIAAAQQEDGYLNSYFTVTGEKRWSNIAVRHELYCAGHLIEAGIAHFEATGKRKLLDVATRFVDHIATVFGPGKMTEPPGHQEIELALVRLHKLTGDKKHLDLARFFLEQRGRGQAYSQNDVPIREQKEIRGHAVRAMYMLCGVADVAALDGDAQYLRTLDRVWDDTVFKKMYITGGIGSSSHNEGFTTAFDLPNETAYAETCAAIALAFFNHRLALLHGDARYADVFERVLFNGLLSGVSLSGDRFFYTNPLASRGQHARQPWFGCACCPTNVVRFLPRVGEYVYARRKGEIRIQQYVQSRATIDGVKVRQETRYPWEGRVVVHVDPPVPRKLDLHLRIPGWCKGARVDGRAVEPGGYVRLPRTWNRGDKVVLDLPLPVRRVYADERVKGNRGRVALMRGPVVYCLEGADHGGKVQRAVLPPGAELKTEHRPDLLGGVTVVRASNGLLAIPYHAWNNRGRGEMVVWIAESEATLPPPPVAWLQASASHCFQNDTLEALRDRVEPRNSDDHSIRRFTWWPRRGSEEWVAYAFDKPRRVSAVEVYWFNDAPRGGRCREPKSWRLLYRDGEEWRPVRGSGFGTKTDAFNVVEFEPVTTDGLRIVVQLKDDFSSGILEWKVTSD